MNRLHKEVRRYREGGLSIVPIDVRTKRPATPLLPHQSDEDGNLLYHHRDADGNKTVSTERSDYPKRGWKVFQTTPATAEEVERWINAGIVSIAVIGGKVSGGVEILDFDVHGYYEQWLASVASKLKVILPTQRTGGGGIQVAWRCENPSGNMKLAWHPGDEPDEWLIAIETRGEAGYAVLPFSLHPSGNTYELLCGDFAAIPTISQALRDELIAAAIKLNKKPEEQAQNRTPSAPMFSNSDGVDQGMTVSDAFNAQHRITDMLIRYGYTESGSGRWSRPGKAESGGVLVNLQDNKSYHMSSNDPLDSEKGGKRQPRSPFDFYVHFEHGDDWRAATKAAAIELGMAYTNPQSVEAVSLKAAPIEKSDNSGIYNREILKQTEMVVICRDVAEADGLAKFGVPAVAIVGGTWKREWNLDFARVKDIFFLSCLSDDCATAAARAKMMINRIKVIYIPRWYVTVSDFIQYDPHPDEWLWDNTLRKGLTL